MKGFLFKIIPTKSEDQMALLNIVPFIILILNVMKIHSSAGLSQNYVLFSCISSFLSLFAHFNISFFLYLINFVVTLSLLLLVKMKYSLNSKTFADSKHTIFIIPITVVLSLVAFFDVSNSFKQFLKNMSLYFNSFALLCQVMLTRRSKRITVFMGFYTVFFITKILVIIIQIADAFVFSGSTMWTLWINGILTVLFLVDLLFFVLSAKQKNDDYELPFSQFNDL